MGKKEMKEKKERPLEKMTAKELRDVAHEIPEIKGAHGMNKEELVAAIKQARGIVDDKAKTTRVSTRDIKKKIKALKAKKLGGKKSSERASVEILRRRISRLKKKTRKVVSA